MQLRASLALVVAVLACVPGVASASYVTAPLPAPDGWVVEDYGAAGAIHAAVVRDSAKRRVLRTSSDGGRTFADRALPAGLQSPTMVAPEADGTLWVVGRSLTGGRALVRVAPDGTAQPIADVTSNDYVTPPAVLGGRRIVALAERLPGVTLFRVSIADVTGDRLGAKQVLGDVPSAAELRTITDTRGVWVLFGLGVGRLGRSVWLIASDGSVQASPSEYAIDPASLEAGVVPGPPGQGGAPRGLYRQMTDELWWPLADAPADTGAVQPVPGSVLALPADALFLSYSIRPGAPAVLDQQRVPSAGAPTDAPGEVLVRETNAMRRQQELPDVLLDPAASRAAQNHADYLRQSGGAHLETPGKPGFTGVSPSDRCAAVGAQCGGEIVFQGLDPAASVLGWWATPLHRDITGTPTSIFVAAGSLGSVQVMNSAGTVDGLQVRPIGLPRGRWSGPRTFSESTPGFTADCGSGESLSGGLAPTAYDYVDPQTGANWITSGPMALVDETTNAAVPGCSATDGRYFVPKQALLPGHTYRASLTYRGSAGGATRPFSWTFTLDAATAAASQPSRCSPFLRAPQSATAATLRKGLRVSVRSCAPTRATVSLMRGRKSVLATRKVTLKRANVLVTTLLRARVRVAAGKRISLSVSLRMGRTTMSRSLQVRGVRAKR